MDYTLLYCAKLASRNGAGWRRTGLGAAAGACFAVLAPLMPVNGWLAAAIKAAAGISICLLACKIMSFRGFLKYSAFFFVFSAVLAGALYGIFSLSGLPYSEGNGYILANVPVGIPMFGALIAVAAARAIKKSRTRAAKNTVLCRITAGGRTAETYGFFDSGNNVYIKGEPVSVLPEKTAEKLTDLARITESIKIHTVAGSRKIKVFTADSLEVDIGGNVKVYKKVKMGVSAARIDCAVLHPDIMED